MHAYIHTNMHAYILCVHAPRAPARWIKGQLDNESACLELRGGDHSLSLSLSMYIYIYRERER